MKFKVDPRKYPRVGGAVMAVCSFSIASWFWDGTIEGAAAGKSALALPAGFAMLISLGCLGVAAMVFGEKIQRFSQELKLRRKTKKDYFLIALFLLPGLIAYFFLRQRLVEIGYQF